MQMHARLHTEEYPRVGSVITKVAWDYINGIQAYVEPGRTYYARHFLACPWQLLKYAAVIGWFDLKRMVRGEPKRPLETVRDALARERDEP